MSKEKSGISAFQKYLTVWVILCMVIGVGIGKFLPQIPAFLNRFEYARVSIPMAILIWVMIYPMMMKVDFRSIKNVGRNPKGLFVTWIGTCQRSSGPLSKGPGSYSRSTPLRVRR